MKSTPPLPPTPQAGDGNMIRIKTARVGLVAKFGMRKYRITKNGEVHAYGIMPNTNTTGWYLFGALGSSETLVLLGITK